MLVSPIAPDITNHVLIAPSTAVPVVASNQRRALGLVFSEIPRSSNDGNYVFFVPSASSIVVPDQLPNLPNIRVFPQNLDNGNSGFFITSTVAPKVANQPQQAFDNIELVSSTAPPLIVGFHVTSTTPSPVALA